MKRFGEILYDEDLRKYNTYKIGGKCKYLIKPTDINNLKELIKYLDKENIKYLVLGKGSNIILPENDYDGAIILLDNINKITFDNNTVEVEAGCTLNNFINQTVRRGLHGLERIYGIPGTVGGCIFQNAGCNGSDIGSKIVSVTYLKDNEIKEIKKEDCLFDYRTSIFKQERDMIILKAKFIFVKGNPEQMKKIIRENIDKRNNTQPLEYPNAGSVFRNPIGYFAGKLIEDNNLKNYHVNDAYISEKHANFIINKGNATASDIKAVIKHIQNTILEKEKIELELEQEIIKF